MWSRLEKTTFLTDAEKRALIGYGPKPLTPKFNPHHLPAGPGGGQFTTAPDGEGDGSEAPQSIAKKPTPPKKPKAGQSGKDGSKDIPDWVRQGGDRPLVGEDGKAFAKRVLDKKYPERNGAHDTGADSEFSKIKKWADRHFE